MTAVIFAGPLPPPVHGQSIATAHLLRLLREEGFAVRAFDTGPGEPGSAMRRARTHIAAAAALLTDSAPHAYLSVNENRGMFATALLAALARLGGKAIVLHHHSSRALISRSRVCALLCRVAGPEALHLAQGENLAAELRRQYGVRDARPYSNIGLVAAPPAPAPPHEDGRVRLGMLSNLTRSKGVAHTLETLRASLAAGLDAELILAGPCADDFARATVEQAAREFPGRFRWLGPVYGADKDRFFDGIDVFLFPTEHVQETQGIVNLEALAHGRPVVAYDRGCIRADVGGAGLVVAREVPFAARAVEWLRGWTGRRQDAFAQARARFAELRGEHAAQHRALRERLAAGTTGASPMPRKS